MSNGNTEVTNYNNICSDCDPNLHTPCNYKQDQLIAPPLEDHCIKDNNSTSSGKSSDAESDEDDIYVDKAIFGSWGCHYLLRQPWTEISKPTVKVFDYAKLKLTDTEKQGILSDRIVASCSSCLDKSPYVKKYVMCKCVLTNKV